MARPGARRRCSPRPTSAPSSTRIRTAIADDETNKSSTLRGSALGLKPIVWIGIALSVFQQLVGINVIFYYSTELWAAVGFTQSNSLIISVVTGHREHPRHPRWRSPSSTRSAGVRSSMTRLDRDGRLARCDGPRLRAGSRGSARGGVGAGRARSRPTCSWSASAHPGVRWSGCCWARSSPTPSVPRPSAWPPRPSGSRTS